MSWPRWASWLLVFVAPVLLALGVFVLAFLSEPSAVGRLRAALYVIGVGGIVAGLAAGSAGAWMLVRRRT